MLCLLQDPKESLKNLSNSPRGAAVRQGLDIIEQAHQQGGAKLQLGAMGEQSSGDHFSATQMTLACLIAAGLLQDLRYPKECICLTGW